VCVCVCVCVRACVCVRVCVKVRPIFKHILKEPFLRLSKILNLGRPKKQTDVPVTMKAQEVRLSITLGARDS
jgi:hypothetical protein